MDETHVVTCFLRNGSDVLLLRRSDAVGSYSGMWGTVAGHAEGDPDALVREEIEEETGLLDAATFVRRGDPFAVLDEALDVRWVVHPYLFDCDSRAVTTNAETVECEWVPPTRILERETVPNLWRSYAAVAPTVETVAADRTHGAAYLSVRALEVLRDRAAEAVAHDEAEWDSLAALARDLRDARPSMTVVANRVNRVATEADGDATAVAECAGTEIDRALTADADAARAAAELVSGARVLTLSRSGTVREALARADPAAIYVAESRPGGEGVAVAEALAGDGDADGPTVTLLPDAAVAQALADEPVDAVLVGADSVLADGRVVNKVGTRAAALSADREGIPVYAVAAADKVAPGTDADLEPRERGAIYDGDAPLSAYAPTFDVTPAEAVTLVTEDGPQSVEDVRSLAAAARERAGWDEDAGEGENGSSEGGEGDSREE
ncbi:NUDIX domain-containing protein [Halomarina halobia]|uniref:NUDIX domain-containing protein n=1 Tax=Halomarina halobia TaxID=3033386 RepID=A0ABD6A9D5_9EURY|nr:NUDIX domain-containing protein [Halomarina sp. PSR21]